ncbi:MAG: HD domain-containing protein [bacterium]|nr:HD domain-containing protein [bacterium]
MKNEDKRSKSAMDACRPHLGFGSHPKTRARVKKRDDKFWKRVAKSSKKWHEAIAGKDVCYSHFFNPQHPDVFIIPRGRNIHLVDTYGDSAVLTMIKMPLSSTDFFIDFFTGDEETNLFVELYHTNAFFRLGGISQLGYLIPPRPDDWLDKSVKISFFLPTFPHTRLTHCLLTGILMEVIMARNGFSKKERATPVLAAACHDIAMPAGGDSIMRIDPKNLSEEINFSWVLRNAGLDKSWAQMFGFDIESAARWVQGKDMFGRLLDVLDKISYTAIDCQHIGVVRPSKVRELGYQYPLMMDVWQDIRFNRDKTDFGFCDPERLFHFLLARAYEHVELLQNPYSRVLDFYLDQMVRPMYEAGVVNRETLLTCNDEWLNVLIGEYHKIDTICIAQPELYSWRKFPTAQEADDFRRDIGMRFGHAEYLKGFKTGLDWQVYTKKDKMIPLRFLISQAKVRQMERMVESVKGYYVYYFND